MNPFIHERDHIQGSTSASVTLIHYGDYYCPYCSEAHRVTQQIQAQLEDDLCYVFRHFPLPQLYPRVQKAAEAAEAAGNQGKFWQMHNKLFEKQSALTDVDFVEYAVELNLDVFRFLREIAEHTHAQRVQEDLRSGIERGITRTPTFFINNVRHDGNWSLKSLLAAIEQYSR